MITALSELPIPGHLDFPRGWRWFGKFVVFIVVTRNRFRTWRRERKRLLVLDRTIDIIRSEQSKAQAQELIHRSRVYNVALYVLLIDRDLSILKTLMVSSFDPWLLRFASRQIALTLYEACDDLTTVLGKDFRDSLAAIELKEIDIKDFNTVCKRLNAFKNEHHQFLYHDIRNAVTAHRMQDSLKFLQAIEAIDPLRVFRLGGDFYEIIGLLLAFVTKSLLHMSQLPIALKEILASPKFARSKNVQPHA